jgi:phage tail protein X
MPAGPSATLFITADTNDVLSSVPQLRSAGTGVYEITILAAAAADATFDANDGLADVLVAEPVPVKAAAVTYPALSNRDDPKYYVTVVSGTRLILDVSDGTNAEIVLRVRKIKG